MGGVDGVKAGQSGTLTMFVVFVALVIFAGKSGNSFWKTLFTRTAYENPLKGFSVPFSLTGPFGKKR